ncbi:hypothetical protein HID58_087034 [Brassica napus]|uniref:Uncharacterized protein n=1 Tax=Brassica napus TaxID=3708 RepID=A0ABQ7XS57_BRANA|nr:hypothetical protein HID58_087034 [Brassica napus]
MPIGDEKAAAVQKSPSDFQDWVDFHYRDDVPLISSSGKCVDLVRQIRGGSRGMSDVDDLIFANDYVGAAKTSIQGELAYAREPLEKVEREKATLE